jgi:WD40 repeat protein
MIRNQFQNEEPQWIIIKPTVQNNWSACLQTLEGHNRRVNSVAFSPDSKLVASASFDQTVRIWSSETGALQQTLEGHNGGVNSVAFSPDSKLVASASDDRTVRIWSSETGALQQTLEGHNGGVNSVAFSPDSKLVASASHDRTVRIWSSETGALQRTVNSGRIHVVLSFNQEGSSYYVLTDTGAISVCGLLPVLKDVNDTREDHWFGYGLSEDQCWLTLNGENLLWLPADARPSCSAVFGANVVIGCSIGRVIFIQLLKERTPRLLFTRS